MMTFTLWAFAVFLKSIIQVLMFFLQTNVDNDWLLFPLAFGMRFMGFS
jgi:hypothetical protein